MKTFSERLKFALYKRDITQTEAARRCCISQQSMNYVINKNLKASKLANKIASGLNINPEWLIYGTGKFENPELFDIPIIDNVLMLKTFFHGLNIQDQADFVVSCQYLGERPFAYLIAHNKLALCASSEFKIENSIQNEYLIINADSVEVTDNKKDISYQIYEWRTFNVSLKKDI